MCGIVGIKLENITSEQLEKIPKLLIETEIRGKHASGISWFDYSSNRIMQIKSGVPISELIKQFDFNACVFDGNISMIAHIRYSTSDIHYHQPLGDKNLQIVHNGVITQEHPSKWKSIYGYDCKTKNDSELIFHSLKNNKNIFEEFPDASISALSIDNFGNIKNYRNGLRPQWISKQPNGFFIGSTKDIFSRVGLEAEKVEVQNDTEKTFRCLRSNKLKDFYKGL